MSLIRALRAFFGLFDRSTVERRGLELLHAHLSPAQCAEFSARRRFEVRGGDTGRRYIVRSEASINVDQLDAEGECVRRWCFAPRGYLARGDVLLAQKLALEYFELEALSVASSYPAQDLW